MKMLTFMRKNIELNYLQSILQVSTVHPKSLPQDRKKNSFQTVTTVRKSKQSPYGHGVAFKSASQPWTSPRWQIPPECAHVGNLD